jgi:hypothetical protein
MGSARSRWTKTVSPREPHEPNSSARTDTASRPTASTPAAMGELIRRGLFRPQ